MLGVSGGIAAYKAAALLRLLRQDGHDVTVVPTAAALRFVGEATWAALSGRPVATDVWEDVHEVPHVRLGREADLVVVAPATADLLARASHGLADDLLTNVLLTATCPVLLAPAMHTEMWQHPATRANVAVLRGRGVEVLEPAVGRLTGADSGPGRLPEPPEIHAAARRALAEGGPGESRPEGPGNSERAGSDPAAPRATADLVGRRVVITAGGTREPLDPVRFLGNASSGRQGVALAEAARDRGALVTLVAAHVDVPLPAGVTLRRVGTAQELHQAVTAALAPAPSDELDGAGSGPDGVAGHLASAASEATAPADVLVMAAAVADFRPEATATSKLKKTGLTPLGSETGAEAVPAQTSAEAEPASVAAHGQAGPGLTLRLVPTVDVLATVSRQRPHPGLVVVGFAAETGDSAGGVLDHARAKLRSKRCDLLVVNDVSGGAVFGADRNAVTVLGWGPPSPPTGQASPAGAGARTAVGATALAAGEVVTRGVVPAGTKRAVADAVWDIVVSGVVPAT